MEGEARHFFPEWHPGRLGWDTGIPDVNGSRTYFLPHAAA